MNMESFGKIGIMSVPGKNTVVSADFRVHLIHRNFVILTVLLINFGFADLVGIRGVRLMGH
jgi:hypothetical protein